MPGPWDRYAGPDTIPEKVDRTLSAVGDAGARYAESTVGATMDAAGSRVAQDASEDAASLRHGGPRGLAPYTHPLAAGGIARPLKEGADVVGAITSPIAGVLDALVMRPIGVAEHALSGGRVSVGQGEADAGTALAAAGPEAGGAKWAARVKNAAGEAIHRVKAGMGHEPGAPPTPEMRTHAEPAAREYVRQIARRSDPTGERLRADPREAKGKPVTAAEALGRPAETQLKVAGRRAGQTPDALEAQLRARTSETAQRVVDDFHQITGVDPETIEGNFAEKAKQYRARAAPLYDKLDAVGQVDSPQLQTILKRPSVQRALPYAYDLAREDDLSPEDIGLGMKETPVIKDGKVLMRGGKPIMMPGEEIEVRTPTMRTWDYLKRGLDEVAEEYRDAKTGQLDLGKLGRFGISKTRDELRAELTNPDTPWGGPYSTALAAGGEAPRMEEAFESVPKLMSPTVTDGEFAKRIARYTPSQMEAHQAGIVNHVRNAAMAGRQRLGEMVTPAYKLKLARSFDSMEKADAITERIEDERFLMAHGQRMTPGIGSDTSETLLANKEQEQAINDITTAAKKAVRGNWVEAVLHLVGSTVEGAYRGAQAPIDEATRDIVGALLMSKPSELARVLEQGGASPEEAERVTGLFAKAQAFGPSGVAMLAAQTAREGKSDPDQPKDGGPWSKYAPAKDPAKPDATPPSDPADPSAKLTPASTVPIPNNNPANLRPIPAGWSGQTGVADGFAVFSTPAEGWEAADKNLLAKVNRHGLRTLNDIIGDPQYGWAPKGDGNNDPASYVAKVAPAMGITGADDIFDRIRTDPEFRHKLLETMVSLIEIGKPVPYGGGIPGETRADRPQGQGAPAQAGAPPAAGDSGFSGSVADYVPSISP